MSEQILPETSGNGATPGEKRPQLERFFQAVSKLEGSDLHLKADVVPRIRKGGDLLATRHPVLTDHEIVAMVREIISDEQWHDLNHKGSVDLAYALSPSERFRINIFHQRGQTSLSARRINPRIPSYGELNLPPVLEKIADYEQGLVMIAGITGSGKSTTLAAMIEQINQRKSMHIVTIEDPIEYSYIDKKSFINQREVGLDCDTFEGAMRAMMREDPDVILIGEMRDRKTFETAVQAAETGHLVFSTVHASSAPGAITRILELFPQEMHANIRQALAQNVRAVMYQKLVASIKPGVSRVPALEIMLTTPSVRKYILDGRENELGTVIRSERTAGMIDFNDTLVGLVQSETIAAKTAYESSPNAEELKMRLKGIKTY